MSIQRKNRNRGKAHERRIAKLTNGTRRGVLGGEDIMHDHFSIECKSRASFVATGWMEQCVKNNKRGKIPIVAVHVTGKRVENDLVIIRMGDFINLTAGRLAGQTEEPNATTSKTKTVNLLDLPFEGSSVDNAGNQQN